jgi:hypothetical protein
MAGDLNSTSATAIPRWIDWSSLPSRSGNCPLIFSWEFTDYGGIDRSGIDGNLSRVSKGSRNRRIKNTGRGWVKSRIVLLAGTCWDRWIAWADATQGDLIGSVLYDCLHVSPLSNL